MALTPGTRIGAFEITGTLGAGGMGDIGGIHGLEDAGDSKALVLELVDGPTLADHIADGPISIDDALSIARQVADALEAAFETARAVDDDGTEPPPLSRRLRPLAITALVAAVLGGAAMWRLKPDAPRPLMRFEQALGGQLFTRSGRQVLTVSPDGQRIVYMAGTRLQVATAGARKRSTSRSTGWTS